VTDLLTTGIFKLPTPATACLLSFCVFVVQCIIFCCSLYSNSTAHLQFQFSFSFHFFTVCSRI